MELTSTSYLEDQTGQSKAKKAKRRLKGPNEDQDSTCFDFFISWTFVLLHFNKNHKQPNLKCVLLMT